jgi:methionyl-tRNA formyltransferase
MLKPGQLHDGGKDGVLVGTGGGVVQLGDVQPEGKASASAEAWSRGARLTADDRLA